MKLKEEYDQKQNDLFKPRIMIVEVLRNICLKTIRCPYLVVEYKEGLFVDYRKFDFNEYEQQVIDMVKNDIVCTFHDTFLRRSIHDAMTQDYIKGKRPDYLEFVRKGEFNSYIYKVRMETEGGTNVE